MPDNNNILIEPARFFGQGECFECGGMIGVAEVEGTYFALSKDGFPIDHDNVYYRCEGVCMKCGSKVQMIRDGMGFRRYSDEDQRYRQLKKLSKLHRERT